MTATQRQLVEDYHRDWNPVHVLRKVWPLSWQRALAVGLDPIDIESAAWEGVIAAALKFDGSLRVTFASYVSHWIRGKVSNAIWHCEQMRANRKHHSLISGDSRVASAEGAGGSRWDIYGVADQTNPQEYPEELERVAEMRSRVRHFLRLLKPGWQIVLVLRYGLDASGRSRTLEDVGRILGVTRQAVEQTETKAFARIGKRLREECQDLVNLGSGDFRLL